MLEAKVEVEQEQQDKMDISSGNVLCWYDLFLCNWDPVYMVPWKLKKGKPKTREIIIFFQ